MHFFVPNDRIFHCLNIPQNSPNVEYTSHLKNVIIYCLPQFPPLGLAMVKVNLISTHSLNCAESHDIGHSHFRLLFPANSRNVTNRLFWIPPRQFHQFSCTFCSKHKVLHMSTLLLPNDMKPLTNAKCAFYRYVVLVLFAGKLKIMCVLPRCKSCPLCHLAEGSKTLTHMLRQCYFVTRYPQHWM